MPTNTASRLLTFATLAAIAACGGDTPAGVSARPAPSSYDLVLTIDSATEYSSGCGLLYCFKRVPASGTIAERLVLAARNPNGYYEPMVGPPYSYPSIAYDTVVFSDSLVGRAAFDSAGMLHVMVAAPFWPCGCGPYDSFRLSGVLDDAGYRGTWVQYIDPHGASKMGRFTGTKR